MHGRIRISLPKMPCWIRIGLSKVHGRFRIGPPQVVHPICPLQISTVGEYRCTIGIMQEKHQNVLFEIELWSQSLEGLISTGPTPSSFFGGGKILQAIIIAITDVEWSPIKENLNKNIFLKDKTVNFTLLYYFSGSKFWMKNTSKWACHHH